MGKAQAMTLGPYFTIAWLALFAGCGKVSPLGTFSSQSGDGSTAATKSFSFSGPSIIDAGAYESNNDFTPSCTVQFPGSNISGRGCMQQPTIAYSLNPNTNNPGRWALGFTQNYMGSPNTPALAKFSLFASLTSLLTRDFGTLGSGLLSIIDSGLGLDPLVSSSSSRYSRFATFPNGDIISVYFVETNAGSQRDVYATIYDSAQGSWGTATLISSGAQATDTASDFNQNTATFCRPSVATSGDGTAMVAWCENDAALGASQISYRLYSNGAWSSIKALAADAGASTLTAPGFNGILYKLSGLATADPASCAAGSRLPSQYVNVGDTFTFEFLVSPGSKVHASVRAVSTNPAVGEFARVTDGNGDVQICATLQNIATAALAGPALDASNSATGKTLGQYGVSILLNPKCSDPLQIDTVQADPAEWYMTAYYNRGLAESILRDLSATSVNMVTTNLAAPYSFYNCASNPIGSLGPALNTGPAPVALPINTPFSWAKSAAVDVAGDGYGNYALVRTLISPYFPVGDVTSARYARRLAGHQYSPALGNFIQMPGTATGTQPTMDILSPDPSCFDGVHSAPCSVRNPRILMSQSGKGLIFFHQQQPTAPGVNVASPNRLWYSTFGSGTGFSGVASILDEDTVCSNGSSANDTSVCETASYVTDISTSGSGPSKALLCQTGDNPSDDATKHVTPQAVAGQVWNISHDVPPIAAAMNSNGQGLVAYHKKAFTGTISTPSCGFVGTFVATYGASSGFDPIIQLDDGAGDTMHAAVAVAEGGSMAVVWEEVVWSPDNSTKSTYIYLRAYQNGVWLPAQLMNNGLYSPNDSMMPSVGINDLGEIVVSFSYNDSPGTTPRRQYVKHLFFH